MVQFPERLPFVHGERRSALIEILALDEQGQRRTHYTFLHGGPSLQYGLYVRRNGS